MFELLKGNTRTTKAQVMFKPPMKGTCYDPCLAAVNRQGMRNGMTQANAASHQTRGKCKDPQKINKPSIPIISCKRLPTNRFILNTRFRHSLRLMLSMAPASCSRLMRWLAWQPLVFMMKPSSSCDFRGSSFPSGRGGLIEYVYIFHIWGGE